jgi:predicted transcriptional regulator
VSIFRTVHDSQNPYCILSRESLWDKNLSLAAVAVWARLMSRPNDWQVNITELCRSCRTSRSKMYKIVNELIKQGYAYRHQGKVGKNYAKVEYLIFEKKMSLEEIQKILPLLKNEEAQTELAQKNNLLNIDIVPSTEEDKEPPTSSPVSPQPEAADVLLLLIEAIKKTKPDLKEPNQKKWLATIERMLRIDKRSVADIRKVLEWLPSSDFWSKNILSAESFRNHFDKLQLQSLSSDAPNSLSKASNLLQRVEKVLSLHQLHAFYCGPDYVSFSPNHSHGYECYKIQEAGFVPSVINLFRKKNTHPKIMAYLEGKTEEL